MAEDVKIVFEERLDRHLIKTVTAVLMLLSALLVVALVLQWLKYDRAVELAIKQSPPDHAAALCYARALDAAVIKTSAMMLAFTVVFLGALYVLRTTTTAFNLAMQGGGVSGTLQTASPGLVMITLGLAVVAVAVLARNDVNYDAPAPAATVLSNLPDPVPAVPGLGFEKKGLNK